MLPTTTVLAHQGESLIIAVPVVLFLLWKLWEHRRGKPAEPQRDHGPSGDTAAADGGGSGDGDGGD